MNLSEDEILQNMLKKVDIVIEVHFYRTNMNLFVFYVDIT